MGGCFSRLLNLLTNTQAQGPIASVDIKCACFESEVQAHSEEDDDEIPLPFASKTYKCDLPVAMELFNMLKVVYLEEEEEVYYK